MIRSILAVVAGVVTWFLVATLGNFLIRALLPGYTAAEPIFAFTLAMMAARLGLAVLSSLIAGFVCAAIDRGKLATVYWCAAILLAAFPVGALQPVAEIPGVVPPDIPADAGASGGAGRRHAAARETRRLIAKGALASACAAAAKHLTELMQT